MASEIPSLRQTSGTDVPSSACFRAKTICSSVNRDFFIGTTSTQGSVYHAGILFLNGTGFWGKVNYYKRFSGQFDGWSSMRVNIQWRLMFQWNDGYAESIYLDPHQDT
ncbi:type II toxin-antitoxin system RelE/ParE family toxin [Yersinia sp. 2540 StPb PI]|uniref:type II toxin-antitoxin system RelE/ParE family toxin n=1 Tax=Yersinia sp. 2540 StPb PI TaxID=3117406 RepID=UPI003FA474F7